MEEEQLILNKWNMWSYLKEVLPEKFNQEPKYIEELRGGIINSVYRVDFGSKKIVLKQAFINAKSRYISCKLNPDRIIKEFEAITLFKKYAKTNVLPQPIFIDRKNYVMITESIPDPFHPLKKDLINNVLDEKVAESIVKNLSRLHNSTLRKKEIISSFDNTENFMNLKIKLQCIDITNDNAIKREIIKFINDSLSKKIALLHGDIAPKNILIHSRSVYFIDLEESYYGDPALDLGYLLAHYFLNAINNYSLDSFYDIINRMWKIYLRQINIEGENLRKRAIKYIGIFLLSRIDGQAKADQVKSERIKQIIRKISKEIILNSYDNLEEVKVIIDRTQSKG